MPQHDGEEDAGTKRRRKNCGEIETYSDELVFTCSGKFCIRKKSDSIQKSAELLQLRRNVKAGREEIRDLTKRRVLKRGFKMHTLAGR